MSYLLLVLTLLYCVQNWYPELQCTIVCEINKICSRFNVHCDVAIRYKHALAYKIPCTMVNLQQFCQCVKILSKLHYLCPQAFDFWIFSFITYLDINVHVVTIFFSIFDIHWKNYVFNLKIVCCNNRFVIRFGLLFNLCYLVWLSTCKMHFKIDFSRLNDDKWYLKGGNRSNNVTMHWFSAEVLEMWKIYLHNRSFCLANKKIN